MIHVPRFPLKRILIICLILVPLVVVIHRKPDLGLKNLQWRESSAKDRSDVVENELKSPEELDQLMSKLETPLVIEAAHYGKNDYKAAFNERMEVVRKTFAEPITEPKSKHLVRPLDPLAGKASATILCLTRNEDLSDIITSIQQLEEQFNNQFGYPYTFLNDGEFTDHFKNEITRLLPIDREVHFGLIDPELWDMPDSIDPETFRSKMEQLGDVQHAEKASYHNMCRFYSRSFYHHPLLANYKYIWRVEPNVNFYCKIDYDVFQFMEDNNKIYGFVLNLYDSPESVKSLWKSTMDFVKNHPQYLHRNGSYEWLKDNVQKPQNYEITGGYSTCHFWTNFEIINLDFLRSKPYEAYMDFLEGEKGFYYERWGDAPVRSLALALFADKSRIHWFRDIGYQHFPYTNCPKSPAGSDRCNGNCQPGSFAPWPSLRSENCLPVWIEYIMSKQELEGY